MFKANASVNPNAVNSYDKYDKTGYDKLARRSIALRHGQIPPGQRAELCRGPARRELRTAPQPR
ncbi:MAG: hypothetical protein ACLR8Y_01750 [Alistipes indistinctus]